MSGSRILVVDDEPGISRIVALALERAGFEVARASDGVDALEQLGAAVPDLVVLDLMMPRLGGAETLHRIRSDRRTAHLPVLMLTARGRLADRLAAFERGADDYLGKPFAPAELVARVRTLLRRTAETRLTAPLLAALGQWSSGEGLAHLARDVETARRVQAALLPQMPPRLAGLEAAAVLAPASFVGGDFYDVLAMDGRIAVAIGDVCGKGISAALLMVMARTLLREIASVLADPAAVLQRLNAALCREMPPAAFVTVALAVLDPGAGGRVHLASGGHPPALHLGARGPTPVPGEGPVVGAFPDAVFAATTLVLAPGDALVLYTDGLVEHPRRTAAGVAGLVASCARRRGLPAGALARALADEALASTDAAARDDLSVVVLRRPPESLPEGAEPDAITDVRDPRAGGGGAPLAHQRS